jgi:hypothetical protein
LIHKVIKGPPQANTGCASGKFLAYEHWDKRKQKPKRQVCDECVGMELAGRQNLTPTLTTVELYSKMVPCRASGSGYPHPTSQSQRRNSLGLISG